jgi:hypothetical protein
MDRVIEQAIPMDAIIRHVAFDSFGNATFFSFKESNKRREEALLEQNVSPSWISETRRI